MYEAFYGLTDKPFQLNPDPSFYFGSRQHQRAMAYLEYGLHCNEGFIVITGEIGAGKTMLVRNLFSNLDSSKVVAATLVSTQLDADDLLRMVASAFGIPTKHAEKADLLLSIEAFLVSVAHKGKRCLLVVDEAQNLTQRAVEELRMLSNFQLEQHALLQSFLIGQPEFRAILQSPQMKQLRQRVIAACHIGPMDAEETRRYIEHRLKCVGWKDSPRFLPDAYQALFDASGGVPRRINAICDRLLLFGFLSDQRVFAAENVTDVAAEITDETVAPKPLPGKTDQASISPDPKHLLGDQLDLSQFDIDDEAVEDARQIISNLGSDDLAMRLANIERTVLRLERNMLRLGRGHSDTLALLDLLINRLRSRNADDKV